MRPLKDGETQLDLCSAFELTTQNTPTTTPPATPPKAKGKRRLGSGEQKDVNKRIKRGMA